MYNDQQNAANAEESVSASEEMNAQAEQMKGVVVKLVTLIGGSAKNDDRSKTPVAQTKKTVIHYGIPMPEK